MAQYGHRANPKLLVMMLALSLLVLGTVAGCAGHKATANPPVSAIGDEIKQAVDLSGMKPGDSARLKKLYNINANDLEGFVLYTAPSNIKAEELAVIKVKDPSQVTGIKAQITKRIDSQSASFKDYLPEEYSLIENHVLKTNGNYLLFVVSRDADKIETVFDKSL